MAIGVLEITLILLIILILFGAKRIPELARSLGKAVSEFKKGMNSDTSEEKKNTASQLKKGGKRKASKKKKK
jgi:sec-independent protein translocase protein TatA